MDKGLFSWNNIWQLFQPISCATLVELRFCPESSRKGKTGSCIIERLNKDILKHKGIIWGLCLKLAIWLLQFVFHNLTRKFSVLVASVWERFCLLKQLRPEGTNEENIMTKMNESTAYSSPAFKMKVTTFCLETAECCSYVSLFFYSFSFLLFFPQS